MDNLLMTDNSQVSQKKEVKEKAYQELMKGADLLDRAYKQQIK